MKETHEQMQTPTVNDYADDDIGYPKAELVYSTRKNIPFMSGRSKSNFDHPEKYNTTTTSRDNSRTHMRRQISPSFPLDPIRPP